jgi:hypothetical protein
MDLLAATECSDKLRDELTVVPTCLHAFRTTALLAWRASPPSPRSSWLSPHKWTTLRPPPACPLCAAAPPAPYLLRSTLGRALLGTVAAR